MPVAHRVTSPNTGVSASCTGAISGSVQVGDIMIASLLGTLSSVLITSTPVGWTLLRQNSPTGFKTWTYWKVRASGDTSAPVWGMDASNGWHCDIWAGFGQHPTSPINVENGAVNTGANTVSVAVTPTVADCALVITGTADTGTGGQGRTWTQTAGMTERVDGAADTFYRCLADQVLTGGAGASQSRSVTVTGATTPLSTHLVAVAPAVPRSFFPFFM